MVKIITDSGADFEPEEIDLLNIECIPMPVTFGNVTYKENVNLTKRIFYNLLKTQPQLPVTSQPSPHQFEKTFKNILAKGEDCVGIFLSSKLSGTYQGAKYVSDSLEMKNCYIIDSLTVSAAQRLLVQEAVKLRNAGNSAKEIAKEIMHLREKVQIYACLDSLHHLEKGGRISYASAKIGTIANIKPVVRIVDGKVNLCHKALGIQRGIHYIEKQLEKQKPNTKYPINILYSHDHSRGVALKESLIKKGYPMSNHSLVNVGAVIGTHIGIGACGIAYVEK